MSCWHFVMTDFSTHYSLEMLTYSAPNTSPLVQINLIFSVDSNLSSKIHNKIHVFIRDPKYPPLDFCIYSFGLPPRVRPGRRVSRTGRPLRRTTPWRLPPTSVPAVTHNTQLMLFFTSVTVIPY